MHEASEFFEMALNNGMEGSHAKVVNLPEDSPRAFEVILDSILLNLIKVPPISTTDHILAYGFAAAHLFNEPISTG
jgi:hypothetical protein